jgi:hypothetical protein
MVEYDGRWFQPGDPYSTKLCLFATEDGDGGALGTLCWGGLPILLMRVSPAAERWEEWVPTWIEYQDSSLWQLQASFHEDVSGALPNYSDDNYLENLNWTHPASVQIADGTLKWDEVWEAVAEVGHQGYEETEVLEMVEESMYAWQPELPNPKRVV